MARQNLKVTFWNDFTGGLNVTANRQNLAPNETPDCQDVVFDNRGGFRCRHGYKSLGSNTTIGDTSYIGGMFSAASEYVWGFNNNGAFWTNSGFSFTVVSTSNALTGGTVVTSATWDYVVPGSPPTTQPRLYFANWLSSSTYYMKHWNGTAFTTLGNAANNDYTNPTGGNAPLARVIANHSGHMWWGDTVESGTRYRSRIRFSHPLQPEDFAADDYFDIEAGDSSDQITALFPFKDMLLVFKRRGVWAVYGYDRESFVVERISTQAGVQHQHAIAASSGVCYWQSLDGNIFAFDGRGVVPVGERIRAYFVDRVVSVNSLKNRLGWIDGQLWVSLDTGAENLLLMYDPGVGQNGAWARFSFGATSFVWAKNFGAYGKSVFFLRSTAATAGDRQYLYDWSDANQRYDYILDEIKIPAYYRTGWFSGFDTALKKRFARPTVAAASLGPGTLQVDVYHDFEEGTAERTLFSVLESSGPSGPIQPSDLTSGELNYNFDRLPSCGRANAIQMKFSVNSRKVGTVTTPYLWWVDSVSLPYLEKAYR